MNSIKKKDQIAFIRNAVGWVYPDLLWLSKEESRLANQQRNELLEALSGWITYSFNGSKLHHGPISPGCLICGSGSWACNFINQLCTRHCFYCPQDRSIKEEHESQTDGIIFKDPAEHILFLVNFEIRGVGFSGGEPLLVLDRLLDHIRAIRQKFGNSLYLWVYTNGDLVDRSVLKKLREAGLDEIRFDVSARAYDLAPINLAKEYIPTVTVEIPAIPEDLDLLKGLLAEMEAIGVNFFNLHELFANEHNYKALRQRNYHFLHQPGIPVYESELCALILLLFAREHRVHLPINYCRGDYKTRFQGRGVRTRQSRVVLKGFEEITNAGYIRSFRVLDSSDKIERMVRRLEEAHCPPALWQCDERKTEVAIHSNLLPYVDWLSAEVAILYFAPGVELKIPDHGMIEGNLIPKNLLVYQERGWSEVAIESWRKLYIEKMSPKEVFRFFYQNFPAVGKDAIIKLQKEADELKKLAELEELESGLPDVF